MSEKMNNSFSFEKTQSELRKLKQDYVDTSQINKNIYSIRFKSYGNNLNQEIKNYNFKSKDKIILLKLYANKSGSGTLKTFMNNIAFSSETSSFEKEFVLEMKNDNILSFTLDDEQEDVEVFVQIYGDIEIDYSNQIFVGSRNGSYYLISSEGVIDKYSSLTNLEKGNVQDFVIISNFVSACEIFDYNNFTQKDIVCIATSENNIVAYLASEDFNTPHQILLNKVPLGVFAIHNSSANFVVVCKSQSNYEFVFFDNAFNVVSSQSVQIKTQFSILNIGSFGYKSVVDDYFGFWFTNVNGESFIVFSKNNNISQVQFHNPIFIGKANSINVYLDEDLLKVYVGINNSVSKSVYALDCDLSKCVLQKTTYTKHKNTIAGFEIDENVFVCGNYIVSKI